MSVLLRFGAVAWRPALLLLGLVAAGLLLRQLGFDGAVARAGEQGPWVFAGVGAMACAVGVPRQVVAYAGGLAFGFWAGAALALTAEIGGCVADFWWARLVARRWAAAWVARSNRAAQLERFLIANAFSATLTLRLLPVGSNIALNLMAGVTGVAAAPFFRRVLAGLCAADGRVRPAGRRRARVAGGAGRAGRPVAGGLTCPRPRPVAAPSDQCRVSTCSA